MSTLLSARDLGKSFPANMLFEGVAMHVESGDRIGLIGPNGAGKTTLMKILAGLEDSDEGEITRRRGLRMAYLKQDDLYPEDATAMSAVLEVLQADVKDDRDDPETRAAISLSKLGFEDPDRLVSELSGGWRKRLSLACALAQDPEVLLLDEPTNHLDLEGVLWLEQFVQQSATTMAMLFVTHDRMFLENTASRIIELSPAYPGGTFKAEGDYSEFLRRKDAFLEAQAAAQSALANKVRRDTAWLRQGIQGRQTRNKTQVVAASERRDELKQTRTRNEAPTKTTSIDFQATERKTKKLLAMHSVSKSMGTKPLFDSLDLVLTPGQRIGLVGVNGAGKTTLLRLMNGELEPDTGTIKRAPELRIVTFSQHRGTLVPTQTLQEALCPVGDMVDYRGKQVHVTGWARRFLFEPEQLSTVVSNLSGGEQARVLIANLMLEPADILLLDEPTNDLDIPSLEVLEQALMEFPGALVLVTHDRFMLERLATEYIGLDDSGGARSFQTHQAWMTARKKAAKEAKRKAGDARRKSASSKPTGSARKLSWDERKEYESMEATILEAESEVERLEAVVADPALADDHIRSKNTYESLSNAQSLVKELYARWVVLEKIAQGQTD
ncbi:MAG: ABC transporter ATP-binding protein [Phycisphaerae bacterium]|nr:ABC transporter ATP-binding protein [Phycisphaerae bacterium]|tara:strand:+ start:7173 stop:9008 length:1836 start_codon:yes stop_codon:yes gene_type:complete